MPTCSTPNATACLRPVNPGKHRTGLAWLNLASGQFTLAEIPAAETIDHLERLDVAELLVRDRVHVADATR